VEGDIANRSKKRVKRKSGVWETSAQKNNGDRGAFRTGGVEGEGGSNEELEEKGRKGGWTWGEARPKIGGK